MSGPESKHALGRGGPIQSAMGAQPEVVPKGQFQPAAEIVSKERRPRPKRADRLQGSQESLDESDGTGPADGAVAVADAVAGEAPLEDRAWLGEEDPGDEGAAGESVEDDREVEGTKDPPHFERAVKLGRVLVTNDAGQEARAQQWYEARRSFPGLIVWRQAVYDQMTYGQLVDAFEELAQQADPFALYPIIRIWPKR
ncbi:MAG TPA: hypothetical protein VE359_03395 [Vicinamibacteria bacterium]|nr:hypothetical protein [Vicinamibacteria bacterium]